MIGGWWTRVGVAGLAATLVGQAQTFKTGVDLIAVDVQVVDRDGHPVKSLTPADFQVTFNGKSHKVTSADLIDYAGAGRAAGAGAPTLAPAPFASTPPSRMVLLVVDAASFDAADARGAAVAAQSFVARLPADDRVGLYTYPVGPKVDPSSNHGLVKDALDHVNGQHQSTGGMFNISPADIIDVQAGDNAVLQRVVAQSRCTGQPGCADQIKAEADGDTMQFEAQAIASIQTMASVFDAMQKIDGRKIVVLVSAGEPTSDRTGGRPDIGDLPMQLGERAARADATVYTLFIDDNFLKQNSADQRQGRVKNGVSNFTNTERDNAVLGRWLDQFSGASGGAFMRVLVGSGESSYDRILLETSAYYRLGVEPAKEDRDGKSHPLKVKLVNQKNVTLRSRAWAIVPAAAPPAH